MPRTLPMALCLLGALAACTRRNPGAAQDLGALDLGAGDLGAGDDLAGRDDLRRQGDLGARDLGGGGDLPGCAAPANATYYVDPTNGDDTLGSGGVATGPCAFRTITRALKAVGAPAAATQIIVAAGTVEKGEIFPIAIPANVSIGTSGAVTVKPDAGKDGFTMAAPASALSGLTIDGAANGARNGVRVLAGSAASTSIANVTVRGLVGAGLVVSGGVATLTSTVATASGSVTARADGLLVDGAGTAFISGTASAPSRFDENTLAGIEVAGGGRVVINGKPGATAASDGSGSVTANGNRNAGLYVQQTDATPPQSTVDGLVAFGTSAGAGVHVFAHSNLKLRNSVSVGNQGSGVLVAQLPSIVTGANDVSKIDLGAANEAGHNLVQRSVGENPNAGVGICLRVDDAAAQMLNAAGNVFSGGRDCSTPNPGMVTRDDACAKAADIGIDDQGCAPGGCVNTNDIIVLDCTHP